MTIYVDQIARHNGYLKRSLQPCQNIDKERASGTVRGPLHRIPFLVKVLIQAFNSLCTIPNLTRIGHYRHKPRTRPMDHMRWSRIGSSHVWHWLTYQLPLRLESMKLHLHISEFPMNKFRQPLDSKTESFDSVALVRSLIRGIVPRIAK